MVLVPACQQEGKAVGRSAQDSCQELFACTGDPITAALCSPAGATGAVTARFRSLWLSRAADSGLGLSR